MKLLLSLLLFISFGLNAQGQADLITGKWQKIPREDLIIQVYKSGNEYQGKVSWSANDENKKPAGFIILDNLVYDSTTKKWDHGKIHDPNSNKTYNASVRIKEDGTLEVRGYMSGLKMFSKRKYFKRV